MWLPDLIRYFVNTFMYVFIVFFGIKNWFTLKLFDEMPFKLSLFPIFYPVKGSTKRINLSLFK